MVTPLTIPLMVTLESGANDKIRSQTIQYRANSTLTQPIRQVKITLYFKRNFTKVRALPKAHEIKPDYVQWTAAGIQPNSQGKL